MIRPRTDRLFDRFRRTGDPRVLAKVFDATAPELWRVAAHLCRDRHAAEDAVQGAFLSAIEARADWDAARPLLPWLLGHLANRVREQHRVSRRVPDPARFELPTVADPADVAAVREVSALCRDALQRLDEPYRTTLERHLVGGLAPHEIASELGVPPGTVRMRLHRGLDQLRQKLPASVLAGGAVASQVPPASLVAMREVVLGAVPGGAAVAVAGHVGSFLIGALVMNKVLLVAASAVVVLSLWLAWPANAVAPLESAERSAVVAERGAAKASSPSPGDGAAKAAVERIAVVPPQPGDTNGRLRVVLRNAGNGEPEVGFGVEVRDPRPVVAGSGPAVPKQETGADGAATFERPAGAVLVAVEAFRVLQGARSVMGAPRPAEVTAGRETELVIELPVQVELDVVVVDPSGAPVPDARIVAFTERELVAPAGKEIGRTDAAGCFRRPFVESVVTVRAVADGRAASPAVELRSGSRRTTLRLGVAEAIVDGVVFGLDGSPLRNAPVAVQSLPRRGDDVAPLVVRTDASGRFEVRHVPPGPCLVFAVCFLADGQSRLASVEATAVAGARTNTELKFGGGASLDVRLRRVDGTAVARQTVSLRLEHRALAGSFEQLGWAVEETDANGEARVDGLLAGRYRAQVAMREQLIEDTIVFAEGETKRYEPSIGAVRGDGTITVRVVDAARQPLAGWIVRLAAKSGRAGDERAVTDADGNATFQRLPELAYRAQVFAAENSFALLAEDVENGATVTLTAPDVANRSGVLQGRLVGEKQLLAGVQVHLHRAENSPASRERIEAVCDAASGVFRAENLPPGRYHVAVSAPGPQPKMLAFRMNLDVGAVPVDMGSIPIGAGSVHVRATFADGRAVPGAVISIGASGMFGPPPGGVDDGLVSDLPAAALDVLVWSEATVPIVAAAEIRSGETTELTVTATPGARVTVRFDDGLATLPSGMLRVRQAGAELFAVIVMPRDPLVRGFAPGRYELEFDDMRGKRCSASLSVPDDLAAREVTLPSLK